MYSIPPPPPPPPLQPKDKLIMIAITVGYFIFYKLKKF